MSPALGGSNPTAHALALDMVLIAVDPSTPNLLERLNGEAKAIRERHPLPIKKQRGRPSEPANVVGIDAVTIEQWRVHRIITLHELRLAGHDPRKNRKQLAAWMFPEVKDQRRRGLMLDRAVELLDGALAALAILDAQTR